MNKKPIVVGIWRPHKKPRNLRRFNTIKQAEKYIGNLRNQKKVHAGLYYIDTPEYTLDYLEWMDELTTPSLFDLRKHKQLERKLGHD